LEKLLQEYKPTQCLVCFSDGKDVLATRHWRIMNYVPDETRPSNDYPYGGYGDFQIGEFSVCGHCLYQLCQEREKYA